MLYRASKQDEAYTFLPYFEDKEVKQLMSVIQMAAFFQIGKTGVPTVRKKSGKNNIFWKSGILDQLVVLLSIFYRRFSLVVSPISNNMWWNI